ncbi:hypothetical protein HanRHA438_Chr11g0517931 [Helianthus annuus]|nr:hypothetical protein HanRHA438_Chr11g0517931 [Helianthus annuus]
MSSGTFMSLLLPEDWYTFAHRKGIPPPSSDERSSLKNWQDNFFWLDDRCLPEDMRWRFKDQSMSFDLGEDFVFDKELVRALIEHKSPIRVIMSLRDALKVPNFDVLDFDLEDQGEDEVPLMKQVAASAQEVRPLIPQNVSEQVATEATSSVPTPIKDVAGSSVFQAGKKSILDDVDSDPEVRSLDEALQYRPSSDSLKSKGIMHEAAPQALPVRGKPSPCKSVLLTPFRCRGRRRLRKVHRILAVT